MIVRRSPTLSELLDGAPGVTFEERKSGGFLALSAGSLNEYRSQSRSQSCRSMTVAQFRARLVALEDQLKLEAGYLTEAWDR